MAAALLAAAAGCGVAAAQVPAQSSLQTMAPAQRWSPRDATALLGEAQRSASEGLRAERYDTRSLQAAIDRGGPDLDGIADRIALALAHDYAVGASPASARAGWGIDTAPIDYAAWLESALARHEVVPALQALLPRTTQYAGLRAALPGCDTPAHCLTIRVNLERWRWLPRELGTNHILVNPAAYRLDLIEHDAVVSTHRIIVGKPTSPTPVFATAVTGVTANPWWNVPQSIVAESVGAMVRRQPAESARRGYVATRGANGRLRVRQRPGPRNALGLVKLEMPNPHSVFIHDTPSRELFEQDRRALSHGCIRTARPDLLAKILLSPEGGAAFDQLMASGVNKTLPLAAPVPVFVAYFTAEPDTAAAGGVHFFDDLYGRDARVAAVLDR